MTDPVLRNLRITQCYHELALAMAQRTGPNANWCTFATWASKQAGQTIRGEDLALALEGVVGAAAGAGAARGRDLDPAAATGADRGGSAIVTPAAQNVASATRAAENVATAARGLGAKADAATIEGTLWDALDPAAAVARASDAVGRGNKKVFEEIAREFARFFDACLADEAPNAGHLEHFRAGLRSGGPPEGQDYLRQAFGHYYEALFELDAKRRVELLLLANLEIGFHEQTRLQPEIAESLAAAFVDREALRRRLLAANFPWRGWLVRLRLFATRLFRGPTPLDLALDAFLDVARQQARLVITEHMMTIGLPGGVQLRLGDDLPVPFPPSLRHIAHPELRALLARLDPTPDSTAGAGAADWADLGERLHFIADMFRCYAEAAELFDAPFTAEQVVALESGQLPGGGL